MATNLDIHEAQTASPAYQQLVADATARVQTGQLAAFRAVNKELIQLHWDLGKMIAERQQANGWGNSVVELLAVDLQKAFPSSSGFSKTNVWRMRAFYLAYRQAAILPPPVGELPPDQNAGEFLPPAVAEIGWTHNYLILEKCKDPNERLFYIHQTRHQQTHRRGDLQHFKIASQGIKCVFPLAGGTHQTGGGGDKIGWRTLKQPAISK